MSPTIATPVNDKKYFLLIFEMICPEGIFNYLLLK